MPEQVLPHSTAQARQPQPPSLLCCTQPRGGCSGAPAAPRYCRFALLKENLDTAGALAILQRHLRCGKAALATAGTKDKRAITCQHVTAFKARAGACGCRRRPARSAAGAGMPPCLLLLGSPKSYACRSVPVP